VYDFGALLFPNEFCMTWFS